MAPGSDQKTEKPSPHKLQKARRQGQIAQSREIPAVAALVGAAAVLIAQGGQWASRWGGLWRETVALAGKTAGESVPLQAAAILALKGGAALILPVLAAAVLSALALGAVQTRGLFAPSLLKFDWSRSNPLSGAGRLLSPR
ncbi:MAG TPA: EscU/YscU/HrcU family type III secretion system export apparatus switch protein, partial [Elusimicrobiota bacterium]|nr:EscU/YscU/HrcU family type III secretion system export apparatus switch protein [Elusimicrobiota bacterium]